MAETSVIIPTLGRSSSLRDCLESLWSQENQDFEIIKVTEVGPLAKLRNDGARKAKGKYLVFIDDDVICSPGWLKSIVQILGARSDLSGVSGPSIIDGDFQRNRDIFKFRFFKFLYDSFFCGKRRRLPGHICESGAWTTGAMDSKCNYEGEVDFLEACNMAYKADWFWRLGGFDESYKGVGDWSEPDLCYRVREYGGRFWFTQGAKLFHRPSKSGAFSRRREQSDIRLQNYMLFSKRWVKPCFRHSLYKQFLKTYYAYSSLK